MTKVTEASEFGLFGEPLQASVTPVLVIAPETGSGSSSGDGGSSGSGEDTAATTESSSGGNVGADLDQNGKVDIFDLSILLRNWNKSGKGDLNGSSKVDVFDLSIILRSWSR